METGIEIVDRVERELGWQISNREDAARRLDAIHDPAMRGYMGDLLVSAERNTHNVRPPDDSAERTEYMSIIEACISGKWGSEAQARAQQIIEDWGVVRPSLPQLKRALMVIQSIRPSGGWIPWPSRRGDSR